jgi:hypothetical protein
MIKVTKREGNLNVHFTNLANASDAEQQLNKTKRKTKTTVRLLAPCSQYDAQRLTRAH